MPRRLQLRGTDRFLFVWLYRLWPGVLNSIVIVKPDMVIRWHRRDFNANWRWKSRGHVGRPRLSQDIRDLIREVSLANSLWGAPRIHGERLKVGIDVAPSTVAKYMVKRRRPPSQSWMTFLRNHADGIASVDFLVVPTVAFRLPFALVILRHDRRRPFSLRLHFELMAVDQLDSDSGGGAMTSYGFLKLVSADRKWTESDVLRSTTVKPHHSAAPLDVTAVRCDTEPWSLSC